MAGRATNSEDGTLPSALAESEKDPRAPPPLHTDAGEVTSKEAPPPPHTTVEADTAMAEVDPLVTKTPEESILPPGQGEISRTDLPLPAATRQQGIVTPSAMGGGEDIVSPEPAPRKAAQGWPERMEEALIGSSISDDRSTRHCWRVPREPPNDGV